MNFEVICKSFFSTHIEIKDVSPSIRNLIQKLSTLETVMYITTYTVIFDLWNPDGPPQLDGLANDNYFDNSGAIVLFDVGSQDSYDNVAHWANPIYHARPEIPVVICGNKIDLEHRVLHDDQINIHKQLAAEWGKEVSYYGISALNKYNLEAPLLDLARDLTNHYDLEFIHD